jgi:hypothetical protein
MPYDPDDTYAYKHSIVDEFFIKTADDNYVVARRCFMEDLNVDFFWLAVHALEKYQKAALLLNGRSGRADAANKLYNHDIARLYRDVHPLAPELLPKMLSKPELLHDELHWRDETPEAFLKRLYKDGRADNRYQLFGYVRHPEDLFKLDQMVFAIRRLCRPLESHFLGKNHHGVPEHSIRERMQRGEKVWNNLSGRLEETIQGRKGETLRHALLNCNFAFAPEDYNHTPIAYGSAFVNPVLVRRILDPLESNPQAAAEADALWNWVCKNIYLPKEVVREMEEARAKYKKK